MQLLVIGTESLNCEATRHRVLSDQSVLGTARSFGADGELIKLVADGVIDYQLAYRVYRVNQKLLFVTWHQIELALGLAVVEVDSLFSGHIYSHVLALLAKLYRLD